MVEATVECEPTPSSGAAPSVPKLKGKGAVPPKTVPKAKGKGIVGKVSRKRARKASAEVKKMPKAPSVKPMPSKPSTPKVHKVHLKPRSGALASNRPVGKSRRAYPRHRGSSRRAKGDQGGQQEKEVREVATQAPEVRTLADHIFMYSYLLYNPSYEAPGSFK